MQGTLREGLLPGLLREIYVGRQSGLLHFARGPERYSVRFVNGNIVHAQSNLPQSRLGEIMVSQGLLGQAEFDRALRVVERTGRRLGEVLVEHGVLNWERVGDALALQVRELLLQVFSWSEGRYEFQAEAESSRQVTLKLSTAEMILEAVRRVKSPAAVRYGLGNLDRTVILSTDPLLRFQRVTLTSVDGYVLSRVDGISSARQILGMIPLPVEEVERSLLGLLCTGLVEYLTDESTTDAASAPAQREEVLEEQDPANVDAHVMLGRLYRDRGLAERAAGAFRKALEIQPQNRAAFAELESLGGPPRAGLIGRLRKR